MLTIQPKVLNNYRPAFKANEEEKPLTLADLDEDSYEKVRDELEDQREQLEDLAENKDSKLPKFVKKALKGGVIITTALLGGMATGWGAKQTIKGTKSFGKSTAMQSVKAHLKSVKDFVVKHAKNLKKSIVTSEPYTKTVNGIKNAYMKFGENRFGKPIVKFLNKIGRGIKKVYNKIASGFTYVKNKIKGVKSKTWEDATVNTVGVSGGIASGVTSIQKEKDE